MLQACAETIRLACRIGLVGGSIEDATGDESAPIHEFALAVERVQAAAEAARDLPFVLTARAENHLWGRPNLDDTIRSGSSLRIRSLSARRTTSSTPLQRSCASTEPESKLSGA